MKSDNADDNNTIVILRARNGRTNAFLVQLMKAIYAQLISMIRYKIQKVLIFKKNTDVKVKLV